MQVDFSILGLMEHYKRTLYGTVIKSAFLNLVTLYIALVRHSYPVSCPIHTSCFCFVCFGLFYYPDGILMELFFLSRP